MITSTGSGSFFSKLLLLAPPSAGQAVASFFEKSPSLPRLRFVRFGTPTSPLNGRGERARTSGLMVPNHAL